jgi:hypothetical protein
MLPSTLIIPPSAAATGILMTRLARFKYLNALAFLFVLGGLLGLTTLRAHPSPGQQIGYQFLFAIGGGMLSPGRLMAVQASQREDVRMATALVSFGTSLGQAFGVALGSTTFQNVWDILVQRDVRSGKIPKNLILEGDEATRSAEIIAKFPEAIREIYLNIAALNIAWVWIVCAVLAAVGFLPAIISRNLSLDKGSEIEYEKVRSDTSRTASLEV